MTEVAVGDNSDTVSDDWLVRSSLRSHSDWLVRNDVIDRSCA